ncbi:MAG: alpha-2-macroglobulin family protein, partial [Acidobacteriota bacterium]
MHQGDQTHSSRRPILRRLFPAVGLALPLFFMFILSSDAIFPESESASQASRPENSAFRTGGQAQEKPDRKRLEEFIKEQKFEQAAKEAVRLREEAKRTGDDAGWAWALIKEVQLRTALHGYETAVRFLKEEAWPAGPLEQDMLELFYAQSLVTYHNAYSWEISRRERVEAKGPVDLKSWTRDQIFIEAWNALLRVWEDRERLESCRARDFPDFWSAGDYPSGIRETLRDSLVYLMARLLEDTSFWTPRQTNELFLLNLENLSGVAPAKKSAADLLKSSTAHPLEKLHALHGEHESWCRRSGRPEGALEARLELLEALHRSFSEPGDRALIRKRLAEILPKYREYPWWAMGQASLAEFTRAEDAADALVRARKLAQDGAQAFPDSPGGKRCLHIAKSIEAPDYSLEAMKTDAPGRRSIAVTYRNVGRLFFRACAVDLMERIRTSKDYNLFPEWREAQEIVEKQKPAASWKTEFPATPDFRDHKTYVELPPSLPPGLYLVAASAREDFARRRNLIQAVSVIVTDLVLLRRDSSSGGQDALILSGETGNPLAGIKVDLYAYDWRSGHRRAQSQTSDTEGLVHFLERGRVGPFFMLAQRDAETMLDSSYLYFYGRPERRDISTSLVYTDRSIYRPGQKLYWKIVAYRGRPDLGQFRPAANIPATLWLEDTNGQRVAEAVRTTNDFGTTSGEFIIPAAGRPLGAWRLRTNPEGRAMVRVEEYKRPTFEVTIKDPERPLRLNRRAFLQGEARYYFGLPVASGTVVWQVKRTPIYPRWWWWESGGIRDQIVAGGKSVLKEDGSFEASFTPPADERRDRPGSGLTYNYTLLVEVTDEGGETRSAVRSFRLGFVSIEGRIEQASGFFPTDAEAEFRIIRADLNGIPKPGKGTWRVVRLVQPEMTLLPADQPLPEALELQNQNWYQTPGDRLRPRWESAPASEYILRLWKEGAEIVRGATEHDQKGEASVKAPGLEAGAYRFLYETKDDFGAVCRERLEFLVTGRQASVRLPLVLIAEQGTVPVGGTARLLLHCGWTDQPLLFETFTGGEQWERRWIQAGGEAAVMKIAVTEELRGGFGVRATAVKDHQFMTAEANVLVPWDNKALDLSFSSFRDKLTPGGRETWRLTVKTPSGKPAMQDAAEILAYMYDRSLDIFAPHHPPNLLNIYPYRAYAPTWQAVLGTAPRAYRENYGWQDVPSYPTFRPDYLISLDGYGIGGPGVRGAVRRGVVGGVLGGAKKEARAPAAQPREEAASEMTPEKAPLRSKFDETAFWNPHLLTDANGTAAVEFTVPDSVTGWRVFVHAVTRDLMAGRLEKEAQSVKELMVRPYLPRFFREGDRAELRVMVNNAGEASLTGSVSLEVFDPITNENLAPAFGLPAIVPEQQFAVKPGGGTSVAFALLAPSRVGTVAFKVTSRAGAFSDGELRPLPVLPGRMHLVQSRFATLKEGLTRELTFRDLARADDPTRIH